MNLVSGPHGVSNNMVTFTTVFNHWDIKNQLFRLNSENGWVANFRDTNQYIEVNA